MEKEDWVKVVFHAVIVTVFVIIFVVGVGNAKTDLPNKDTLFNESDCLITLPYGFTATDKCYAIWTFGEMTYGKGDYAKVHRLYCYYESPKTGGKASCELHKFELIEERVKEIFTRGTKDECRSVTPGWMGGWSKTLANTDDRSVVLCGRPGSKPDDPEFHEIVGNIRYHQSVINIRVESQGSEDIVKSVFDELEKSAKAVIDGENCQEWCSKMDAHFIWDGESEWPECKCICDFGYGWDGEKCVDCKTFCEGKGEHWVYDSKKSEPNVCECKCEDGYKPDSQGECKKVDCPENSTNVADLGGSCPKDRKKLNDYCCCDPGYVPWGGVCLKEEDVPGFVPPKAECGKWGCQEGENCLNCRPDCDCVPPEICDPLSQYADPKDSCSPKVAYIFVSSGLASYQYYWDIYRINDATRRYRSLGYKIVRIRVNGLGDIAQELAKPSTKAIAYFGHGHPSFPSLENDGPITISLRLNTEVKNNYIKKLGLPQAEASQLANAKSINPNLDYAYIHTCYSLGDRTIDTSLADYLLRPGGTYWGEEGMLYSGPWDDLSEYVKP
jgi:hypothetical protein